MNVLEKYVINGGKPLYGEIDVSGAKNAAVLAAQMLALSDDALAARLRAERADMAKTIAKKNEALQAEAAAL